jgi:phage terminase large subunit GpA-like protein
MAKSDVVRFCKALSADQFSQLASERRVVRYRFGRPVPVFERIPGRRAEALDSVVHAMAARGLVKAGLVRRENQLRAIVSPPVLPAVIRSAWMDR